MNERTEQQRFEEGMILLRQPESIIDRDYLVDALEAEESIDYEWECADPFQDNDVQTVFIELDEL